MVSLEHFNLSLKIISLLPLVNKIFKKSQQLRLDIEHIIPLIKKLQGILLKTKKINCKKGLHRKMFIFQSCCVVSVD